MKKYVFYLFVISVAEMSCSNSTPTANQKTANSTQKDSAANVKSPAAKQTTFILDGAKAPTVQNGENIEYYDNKTIKIRGMMKDGKRDGVWKSWYEDGKQWSETTFSDGKKKGKTTTWFQSGQKRYEGFYNDDIECGKWTIWNDKGVLIQTKDYDKKP